MPKSAIALALPEVDMDDFDDLDTDDTKGLHDGRGITVASVLGLVFWIVVLTGGWCLLRG